jgi:predicted acylesterase/phospholipase RssA
MYARVPVFIVCLLLHVPCFSQDEQDYQEYLAQKELSPGQADSTASPKTAIALISSGAVSLGSYQAGFHYYEIEWLKQNRHLYDVKIIAGASAGAINAMLSALALADTICPVDTGSVFYRAWLPIGLKQLKGNKDPLGIINRENMDRIADTLVAQTLERLTAPARSGDTSTVVDLVLAVTSTRVKPIEVPLSSLRIPKVKDQFIMRVRKERDGPIQFHNMYYDDLNLWWSALPFNHRSDKEILKGIVYASSAFPGAFPPFDGLPLYLVNTSELRRLKGDDPRLLSSLHDDLIDSLNRFQGTGAWFVRDTPLLVDGGIINNEPIRLAYRLTRDGLDSSAQWNATFKRAPGGPANEVLFLYLNPGNGMYPAKARDSVVKPERYVSYLAGSFSGIFNAAMSNELYALLEDDDKIDSCVRPTKNYSMPMSGYLFNFFGFLEKSFRQFDFYLGMYDAERYMRTLPRADRARTPVLRYYVDTSRYRRQPDSAVAVDASLLRALADRSGNDAGTTGDTLHVRCEYLLIRTILDSLYHQLDAMNPRDPRFTLPVPDTALLRLCDNNLKICFQTSLDRVWARWKFSIDRREEMSDSTLQRYKEKWKAAMAQAPLPPRVRSTLPEEQWERHYNAFTRTIAEKDEESALIDELGNEKYRYRDIGFHQFPLRKKFLKYALVNNFTEIGFSAVSNTDFSWYELPQKYLFWRPAISRLLNFYFYAPKGWYWTISYEADRKNGGWSAGWSQLLYSWDRWYFNRSYSLFLTGRIGYYGYPETWFGLAGIESELFGSAIAQYRIATEGLYLPIRRQQRGEYGLQVTPSVTFLELLRFGVGLRWHRYGEGEGPLFDRENLRLMYQAGIEFSHRDFQSRGNHEGWYTWLIPAAITAGAFGLVASLK